MDVTTFGSTSFSCSAQYIKNCNAKKYAEQFEEAATAIIKYHYVDDCFDSVDSHAKEVRGRNQKLGFQLTGSISKFGRTGRGFNSPFR